MFFFKACPKCHGDMYTERDQYGSFIECIHCGLIRDVKLNQEHTNNRHQSSSGAAVTGSQRVPSLVA